MSMETKRPRATYRLQFHRGFTLRDALAIVPYLAALGVSHAYASPLLAARAGSTHGYDVCDPTRVNPEVGTAAEFEAFVAALRERGLGLVLDIVPNHMAAARENPWWWDVLRNGRKSPFADYFDIDWESPGDGLRGKVLLPVLGDELQQVLERDELGVLSEGGEVMVRYFDHRYPVNPETLPAPGTLREEAIAGFNTDRESLVRLLELQHYRLSFWRQGDHRLNYRRFFTITDLAGIRVERPEVFTATHNRIIDWHRRGWIDGVRVDHPDGLRDPQQYLSDLRESVPGAWIVVEKILEPGEDLPVDWPVDGTTGYDYLARVDELFVDPAGERPITEFYSRFTGEPTDYGPMVREKKRWILTNQLLTEVERLVRLLEVILAARCPERAVGFDETRQAIVAMLVCFPVYRTYAQVGKSGRSDADRAWIAQALASATQEHPTPAPWILTFIGDLLQDRLEEGLEAEFVMRFQQLAGPAMAKGVEDTTFYCFNRLVVLNEVGGDPSHFGVGLQTFHAACRRSLEQWPGTMLASTTHDTKRSGDVRARLTVLSEIPDRWAEAVRRWSDWNERHRRDGLPDRNAEYLFYQILVGAWPLPVDRALAYMEKASREAKQHTNWTDRNAAYDEALAGFVSSVIGDPEFVGMLEQFLPDVIVAGRINSLAQTLLKLTTPGVPDLYQGTELWDLSLVDPDNRRPVDYGVREEALKHLERESRSRTVPLTTGTFREASDDGRIKMSVIHRTLHFRRLHELLYRKGDYLPLSATGVRTMHVCAFARSLGGTIAITVVPRLVHGLAGGRDPIPVGGEIWGDTRLALPPALSGCRLRNVFTGAHLEVRALGGNPSVMLAEVLADFPVALLEKIDPDARASTQATHAS